MATGPVNLVDAIASEIPRMARTRSAATRLGWVKAAASGAFVQVTVGGGDVLAGYPATYTPVVGDQVLMVNDRDNWYVVTRLAGASGPVAPGGGVPVGGIIMWSGAVSAVPAGWALCNGANGTPDLRGRFVTGASGDTGGTNSGASYDKGAKGGADSVTLSWDEMPVHGHATDAQGSHNHWIDPVADHVHTSYSRSTYNTASGASNALAASNAGGVVTTQAGMAGAGAHGHSNQANGSHGHSALNSGSGWAHENRPLYYALAYIMRTV